MTTLVSHGLTADYLAKLPIRVIGTSDPFVSVSLDHDEIGAAHLHLHGTGAEIADALRTLADRVVIATDLFELHQIDTNGDRDEDAYREAEDDQLRAAG